MSIRKKLLFIFLPGILGFGIFYIIPFTYSLYFSVIDNTFNRKFVGLGNFIDVLQNRFFRLALKNTFEFTIVGVPLLILLSFTLAVMISSISNKVRPLKVSLVLPILLPSASVVLIWRSLFGDNTEFMQYFYSLAQGANSGIFDKLPIYLFFIWKNTGYNVILFLSAMTRIPREYYEAAYLDGSGKLRSHIFITLPLILPVTFFVLIISLVNSFRIFKEVYLFYGTSYPKESVYIVQHYMNNHFNKLNYQYLSAGAIIFAVIVYVIVTLCYVAENKVNKGVY